jgi:hypothetical protein
MLSDHLGKTVPFLILLSEGVNGAVCAAYIAIAFEERKRKVR